MTSRFILPFADVGNGITPFDGAKLFFFESETSTPKNTYSDPERTVPNANPVVSDAEGVFGDIFLEPENYKVVLKDKNNVQIWEADPVGIDSSTVVYRGTNQQVFPATGSSYSYYGQHDGVTNFWGGGTDGGAGEHAGLTIYGKDHATTPEDIKLRSRNIRPLWYKSQLDTLGTVGTWSMETRALIDVGPFICTSLSANSTETRVRIDDADLTLGDSTSETFYEVNHRNDDGYMQWAGGTSQGSGFTFRAYGGSTGEASTSAGAIWYSDNVQVLRFRQDLSNYDFKGNAITGTPSVTTTPDTVANLPAAPTVGMRAFVNDSTVAAAGNFGAIVAGGSTINVPVFYDGTQWRIG